MSKQSGKANNFQRDYLEANLIGTKVKGHTVISVSNKYINTEQGVISKAGLQVTFEERQGTRDLIRPDTSYDGDCSNI